MTVSHGGIQNFMKIEGWVIPVFWNKTPFDITNSPNILLVFDYLKMDTSSSSGRSVINYQSARRHNPDDCKIFNFYVCWSCISVYLSQYLTNLMHKICFTVSFISCLYMFRAYVLIIRRSELYYTASGIITPIGQNCVTQPLVSSHL